MNLKLATFLLAASTFASPITRPTIAEDGHGIQPSVFIGANVFAIANSVWLVGYEDQRQPSHEGPDAGALGDYNDWLGIFAFDAAGDLAVQRLGGITCCPAAISWSSFAPGGIVTIHADIPAFGIHDHSGGPQFYVERLPDTAPVPEPSIGALLGFGLLALALGCLLKIGRTA